MKITKIPWSFSNLVDIFVLKKRKVYCESASISKTLI